MEVSARVKRRQDIGRLETVKADAGVEIERATEPLHATVECVFTDDVEMHRRHRPDDSRHRVEKHRVILDTIEAGHVKQAPRRAIQSIDARKITRVDAQRHALGGRSMATRKSSHVLRADGRPRRGPNRRRHGAAVDPPPLQAVADIRERDELAAVERHDRRNGKSAGDPRRDDAGGNRPIRVEHVESTDAFECGRQPVRLAQPTDAGHGVNSSEVVNRRTA